MRTAAQIASDHRTYDYDRLAQGFARDRRLIGTLMTRETEFGEDHRDRLTNLRFKQEYRAFILDRLAIGMPRDEAEAGWRSDGPARLTIIAERES